MSLPGRAAGDRNIGGFDSSSTSLKASHVVLVGDHRELLVDLRKTDAQVDALVADLEEYAGFKRGRKDPVVMAAEFADMEKRAAAFFKGNADDKTSFWIFGTLSLLLFAAAIAAIGYGISQGLDDAAFVFSQSESAEAVVIDFTTREDVSGGGSVYVPALRFSTTDGTRHEVRDVVELTQEPEPKEVFTLHYDPADPLGGRIILLQEYLRLPLVMIGLGLFFFVMALPAFFAARNS